MAFVEFTVAITRLGGGASSFNAGHLLWFSLILFHCLTVAMLTILPFNGDVIVKIVYVGWFDLLLSLFHSW